MITQEMRRNARVWADETLELLECPVKVRIEFNERFTARMGDARFSPPGPRIRLSIPMWPRVSKAERRETVIHEICHIAVLYEDKALGRKRSKPHGLEWKSKMRKCGLEPQTYHDFDVSQLPGSRRKAKLYCGCNSHAVTPRKFAAVVSGQRSYRCRKCKKTLTVEPQFTPAPKPAPQPKPKSMAERIADWIGKTDEK